MYNIFVVDVNHNRFEGRDDSLSNCRNLCQVLWFFILVHMVLECFEDVISLVNVK